MSLKLRSSSLTAVLVRVPSSLWFFLAGTIASVSTSFIATIPSSGDSASKYLASSGPWMLTALLLAWLGLTMEDVRRSVDRLLQPNLTIEESRLIEDTVASAAKARVAILVALTVISFCLSILCTWWLFHKTASPVASHPIPKRR